MMVFVDYPFDAQIDTKRFFPSKKQFQFNLESVCCDKFLEEGRKDQLWSWREEGE
jgi:hypothetical protein